MRADLEAVKKQYILCKELIQCMGTTSNKIMNKYREAGATWHDEHYVQLGRIIQECSESLLKTVMKLSSTLNGLEQAIAAIKDYEQINFGRGSSGVPNNSWPSAQPNSDSSGTSPNMSQYRDIIINRHSNGIESVRRVFDRYSEQLVVQDNNYPTDRTAHYCPVDDTNHPRGVYYSAINDMTNPRGVGTTYYHELAHMIDHAATGFLSNLSNSTRFRDALVADGQQILTFYHGLYSSQQHQFMQLLNTDAAHSMSDLVDATTCGELYGSYGHTREYWSREGNIQAEAFAHFFEASMGDEYKYNLLSTYFPTAFGIFMELIDSLCSDPYEYVLTRRR